MKPFGSRRTYAKCIVLRVKAGQARDFKLTLKNRKTERQKKCTHMAENYSKKKNIK